MLRSKLKSSKLLLKGQKKMTSLNLELKLAPKSQLRLVLKLLLWLKFKHSWKPRPPLKLKPQLRLKTKWKPKIMLSLICFKNKSRPLRQKKTPRQWHMRLKGKQFTTSRRRSRTKSWNALTILNQWSTCSLKCRVWAKWCQQSKILKEG